MAKVKSNLNIDLEISPIPLSDADRVAISNAIADYKQFGRKPEPSKRSNTKTPMVVKDRLARKSSRKKSSVASIKP